MAGLIERHCWELMLSGRSKQVYEWARLVPERLLFENAERLSAALWNGYNRTGSFPRRWRVRLDGLTGGGPDGARPGDPQRTGDARRD